MHVSWTTSALIIQQVSVANCHHDCASLNILLEIYWLLKCNQRCNRCCHEDEALYSVHRVTTALQFEAHVTDQWSKLVKDRLG